MQVEMEGNALQCSASRWMMQRNTGRPTLHTVYFQLEAYLNEFGETSVF